MNAHRSAIRSPSNRQKDRARDQNLAAGRAHAQDVSLMCSRPCGSDGNPIPFNDVVVTSHEKIGKGRLELRHPFLNRPSSSGRSRGQSMIDEVGGELFLNPRQVLVIDRRIVVRGNEGFELFTASVLGHQVLPCSILRPQRSYLPSLVR